MQVSPELFLVVGHFLGTGNECAHHAHNRCRTLVAFVTVFNGDAMGDQLMYYAPIFWNRDVRPLAVIGQPLVAVAMGSGMFAAFQQGIVLLADSALFQDLSPSAEIDEIIAT